MKPIEQIRAEIGSLWKLYQKTEDDKRKHTIAQQMRVLGIFSLIAGGENFHNAKTPADFAREYVQTFYAVLMGRSYPEADPPPYNEEHYLHLFEYELLKPENIIRDSDGGIDSSKMVEHAHQKRDELFLDALPRATHDHDVFLAIKEYCGFRLKRLTEAPIDQDLLSFAADCLTGEKHLPKKKKSSLIDERNLYLAAGLMVMQSWFKLHITRSRATTPGKCAIDILIAALRRRGIATGKENTLEYEAIAKAVSKHRQMFEPLL